MWACLAHVLYLALRRTPRGLDVVSQSTRIRNYSGESHIAQNSGWDMCHHEPYGASSSALKRSFCVGGWSLQHGVDDIRQAGADLGAAHPARCAS